VHDALKTTLGSDVAGPLAVACSLGSAEELARLLERAGLTRVEVEEVTMHLPLGELERFVPFHLASTPMAGVVRGAGDEAMAAMVAQGVARLDPAHTRDVVIPFRQLIATATHRE